MDIKKYSLDFAGEKLTFEIGRVAKQANGAVLASWGDAVVLATCVMSDKEREGIDFFPLSVEFEERLYAAGFIKHNRFMKREGKISDEAVLSGRMIDRTLRPRFDQSLRREVQVIITVLSIDDKANIDMLGMNAASLALLISDIPWRGPIAGLRVGLDSENNWEFCPTHEEQNKNSANLIIAGTQDKINMIESAGQQITEDKISEGTRMILPEIQKLMDFQVKIAKEIGRKKQEDVAQKITPEIKSLTKEFLKGKIKESVFVKGQDADPLEQLKEQLFSFIKEKAPELEIKEEKATNDALAVFEEELNDYVHNLALKDKKRVDGRKFEQIRDLSCEIDVLPRTHGSAIFNRGLTQALSVVTLGSPSEEQMLDGMETHEETKRYFHHYNFLPFSTGEVKRMGAPNRREIGHGTLAEKALVPVLPNKEDFPYTIRVVSEILSSNGSSSMASTCGSTLSLMAAGVPIQKPVAGIALGLMMNENDEYEILTDIQGPEDHYGDMDLKVAGTKDGITAIQMDVKIDGIKLEMFEAALQRGKKARLEIIKKITDTIATPKKELSTWAPRVYTIQINPDKIRDVIGAGGKVINKIVEETGVNIDIEDSGLVLITAKEAQGAQKAIKWIEDLTHEVQAGEVYEGTVVKIMDFGAFVEILPGQDGLVHISQLADHHVEKVEDVVKEGDTVTVQVRGVDDKGRINLTLKDKSNGGQPKSKPTGPAGSRQTDSGANSAPGSAND